jgi:hypothetical protein
VLITLESRITSRARDYVRDAAAHADRKNFPGVTFAFLPADIVSQILNFGMPVADRHSDRRQREAGRQSRVRREPPARTQLRTVPGLVDARIQQPGDAPAHQSMWTARGRIQAGFCCNATCREQSADHAVRQLSRPRRRSGSIRATA